MYKNIIFDMDGTLVNTYEGIYNSYKYATSKMELEFRGHEFVNKVIGAPLKDVFIKEFNLLDKQADEAVYLYRSYYRKKGKQEAHLYEGMDKVLTLLKDRGCKICIATLKKEEFAKEIAENMGIAKYFDIICGVDEKDSYKKSDLITKCIEYIGGIKQETILIGDSEYDLYGAREAGVDFLAVTYGFGFKEYLIDEGIKYVASKCVDIIKMLIKETQESEV